MVTSTAHTPDDDGLYEVTFHPFRHLTKARRLLLAGSFNGWVIEADDSGGIRSIDPEHCSVCLHLPEGEHEYKYYDLEQHTWLEIPTEPLIYWDASHAFTPNPFGTLNCRIRVGTNP